MAYIVDGDLLLAKELAGRDPLPFEQQVGVLRLALNGHEQSVKCWREFRGLNPAGARLVEEHVTKAAVKDKPVKVKRKPPKGPKVQSRVGLLREWANDPDPQQRESARAALAQLGRAG